MQVRICVRLSARTSATGAAHCVTTLFSCTGNIEKVTAQWSLDILSQTATADLEREEAQIKETIHAEKDCLGQIIRTNNNMAEQTYVCYARQILQK